MQLLPFDRNWTVEIWPSLFLVPVAFSFYRGESDDGQELCYYRRKKKMMEANSEQGEWEVLRSYRKTCFLKCIKQGLHVLV